MVTVNDQLHKAYIDFGSKCLIIKASVARVKGLEVVTDDLPKLKGFGSGNKITPIGSCDVSITTDAVTADIKAFVVEDELLNTDLLIGQKLTELPLVVVYKTSSDLYLYSNESSLEKTKLFIEFETSFSDTQAVAIYTDTDLTGQIYVPSMTCLKENCEYLVLQGIYTLNKGQGHLMVVNLSGKEIT
ncbi:putative e3 ubiquitin ligase [Operophtera brumata]|uniref:Putative e3 ubiquitin ligase n=1 Tax=Operophtera brumata TaxID=104452 RepID=A0A0L7L288_OPEBR|nr:putative e3 ubiquitin ligase [Operophtera brumata]